MLGMPNQGFLGGKAFPWASGVGLGDHRDLAGLAGQERGGGTKALGTAGSNIREEMECLEICLEAFFPGRFVD